MRKIAAFLLCFCLLLSGSTTVFAQEVSQEGNGGSAVISVKVPDSHKLTVTASHAQVFIGGVAGDSFDVERLSEPTLLIRPESGYKVTKVTVNGVDVTEQVKGGYFTLTDVYENKALAVETEAVKPNSDSTHDISGTITDKDGNPVPDATVDIGGHTGKTDDEKSPQTGDNSHITVWIALVPASGAALTGSLLMGGRRKRRRDS